MERPAHVVFLRSMLWLVVVIGAVMFCWFDVRKSALRPEDGGILTTTIVGAVQPWLTVVSQGGRGHSISPTFLSCSALAGLFAIGAGIGIYCTRRTSAHAEASGSGLAIPAIIVGAALALAGYIDFTVTMDEAIGQGVTDFQRPDHEFIKSSALLHATRGTAMFFVGTAVLCTGAVLRRRPLDADAGVVKWNRLITVTGGIAAVILLLYGISAQMLHGICRVDFLALPLVLFAASAAVVRLINNSASARPASADAIPELALAVLGCLSAAMPWDSFAITSGNPWDIVGSGWRTNEGGMVSFIYLILGLVLLVSGGRKNRAAWRTVLLLLAGLASGVVAYLFAAHPIQHPTDFGWSPNGLKPIYHLQTGWFVSMALSLATILVAAIQLRNRLAAGSNAASPVLASDKPRLSRTALVGIIWAPFTLVGWPVWQFCLRQFFDDMNSFRTYPAWYVFAGVVLGLLAATAWLGSTILGGVAIAQIKRSGGKLYGLPMAAAALLVHPLLALGSIAFYITNLICFTIAFNLRTPVQPVPDATPERGLAVIDFAVIDSLVALVVMFLAARFAWRKISGQVPTVENSGVANFQSWERPLDHRVAEAVTAGIPGWFNARAKWVQSLVQTVLMLIFLVGLLAFISFNMTASGKVGEVTKRITIGNPSPWLEFFNEPDKSGWLVHPISSSALLGLLGAVAVFIYEKIRRSRPGFDAEKDRRSTRIALVVFGVVIVFVVGLAVMLTSRKPVQSPPRSPISVPSPGAITSGFGAEFTVPAGQVAVFEVMAERDGGLVPVPPHCAYVKAPADHAVKGTFRWSREPNQMGNGKRWGIEVTSGAGNGKTGGLLLADDLDAATGASGLILGSLTPNEEAIHGSGKVRLRVTTLAHNSKTGASGVAHTDWREPKVPKTGKSGE